MRTALSAITLAVGTLATVAPGYAQSASGWVHEVTSGLHSASFTGVSSKLEFRCKGSATELVLYYDPATLDPALQGRPAAIFAIVVDDSDQVVWIQAKLIALGNTISIGVGGAAADQIARLMTVASRTIATSLMTMPPDAATPQFNPVEFPAAGAADAIKAAYAGCGIRF